MALIIKSNILLQWLKSRELCTALEEFAEDIVIQLKKCTFFFEVLYFFFTVVSRSQKCHNIKQNTTISSHDAPYSVRSFVRSFVVRVFVRLSVHLFVRSFVRSHVGKKTKNNTKNSQVAIMTI